MRRLLVILATLVATLLVASCSDIAAGDSLVVDAAVSDGAQRSAYGTAESTVDGVTLQGFAGAAPCDYIGVSQSAWDRFRPKKISFAWSGNNLTPCMADRSGQRLTGTALIIKYHDDLAYLTKWWTAKGVKIIYSAPLCVPPGVSLPNGDPALRRMESGLAYRFRLQGYRVAYSDYAAKQICPDWN